MLRPISELKHLKLRASDGDFGHVKEIFFDDTSWMTRYLVADTGGWLSGRQVLISPFALRPVDELDRVLPVNLTKKQIEDSPLSDTDEPLSRQFEDDYYDYYGWPGNWSGGADLGAAPYLGPGVALAAARAEDHASQLNEQVGVGTLPRVAHDPRLRSSADTTGHHLHASDGDIGHVVDFLVDDVTWKIGFIIAATTNWWPGKKVLISPRWIRDLDWSESRVVITATRAQVQAVPEYRDQKHVTADHEAELHRHFELPGLF